MPAWKEAKRGGVVRYRTIRKGKKVIHIAVVRKSGLRGGHTVAGKPRQVKGKQSAQ